MAYKSHNFCNGQVLEAGPLNEMDLAIVDLAKKATISGKGAPNIATEGAVGRLYMDEDTGDLYKCIAAEDGVYTWVLQTGGGGGGGSAEGAVRYDTEQNLTADEQAQARANIGAVSDAAVSSANAKNIQFFSYGNMKEIYQKAGAGGQATKELLNDEIVFTPISGRSSAAYINYLFGSTTTPIDAYEARHNVPNRIVVDMWYSTNSAKYNGMIRCAQAPIFWYFPLKAGENVHARFSLDLTGKTLQHIGVQYAATSTDEADPITIHKVMVWYGEDQYINPVVVAENCVRPVKYKKILSIGDSLTNVENPTGAKYVGDWQAKLAEILHIPERQKLGVAGTALSKFPASGTGSENSIYAKIQALEADETVDLITLWGGTNDWNSGIALSDFETELPKATRNDSTFCGGALTDIETLIQKFPKARIVIVGTTPRSWSNNTKNSRTTPNANGKYLQEYNDALRTIAEYYGLPFVDLMKTSGVNTLNITNYMVPQQASDGTTYYLHFNELGEETVSKRLAYFINAIG